MFIRRVRYFLERFPIVRKLKYSLLPTIQYLNYVFTGTESQKRNVKHGHEVIISAPEFKKIQFDQNAGKVKSGKLIMHNGIKVLAGCYYGYQNLVVMKKTKGVHEPQEEYAFSLILDTLDEKSVMIELGAYWGFYSLWFAKKVAEAECHLFEPVMTNLEYGRENFRINKLAANFNQSFINKDIDKNSKPQTLNVDTIITDIGKPIAIVHADIQGYELNMLKGAQESINKKLIDYFFISTHSNELHEDCLRFLKSNGYNILCEANLDEAYAADGVIVAKRGGLKKGITSIEISKKKMA